MKTALEEKWEGVGEFEITLASSKDWEDTSPLIAFAVQNAFFLFINYLE